jgi:hypothetical protein
MMGGPWRVRRDPPVWTLLGVDSEPLECGALVAATDAQACAHTLDQSHRLFSPT